jgi:hypothetical protein
MRDWTPSINGSARWKGLLLSILGRLGWVAWEVRPSSRGCSRSYDMAIKWALMCRTGVNKYGPEFDEFEESTVEEQRAQGWELMALDSEIPYVKKKTPETQDDGA